MINLFHAGASSEVQTSLGDGLYHLAFEVVPGQR
jgi:hypothetical protein